MTLNLSQQLRLFSALLLGLSLYGCSNALPRTEDTTRSRWNSFAEAMADYEKITPYATTVDTLKDLGFDPFTQPNIKILSYLEITERFMPNQSITLDDLDPGLSFCLRSRSLCQAYEARPAKAKTKRVGNVFMDLLTFKRRTVASGWSFNALVVLSDGIVVYKVWSGDPVITGDKLRDNPLGPLQGVTGSTLMTIL